MIPCIKYKCIKFPACRNRQFINCTLLRDYCDTLNYKYVSTHNKDTNWDEFYNHFPNIAAVQRDRGININEINIVDDGILLKLNDIKLF